MSKYLDGVIINITFAAEKETQTLTVMKTGSKKLRYNLSGIMKYAHSMFNPNNESFSVRLKRAWALAKSYMTSGKATGQFVVAVSNAPAQSYDKAVSSWYESGSNGRTYFGD